MKRFKVVSWLIEWTSQEQRNILVLLKVFCSFCWFSKCFFWFCLRLKVFLRVFPGLLSCFFLFLAIFLGDVLSLGAPTKISVLCFFGICCLFYFLRFPLYLVEQIFRISGFFIVFKANPRMSTPNSIGIRMYYQRTIETTLYDCAVQFYFS